MTKVTGQGKKKQRRFATNYNFIQEFGKYNSNKNKNGREKL